MYIPEKFRQTDSAAMQQLISEQPLASLIVATEAGMEASHIPLYWVTVDAETAVLRGHVAKANKIWQLCATATDVLVIFSGPQVYISPNYYATKQIDAKVVPTWNYLSVHLHGQLVARHEADWKREMLNRLTNQQEASQAIPWQMTDAPADYLDKQLQGIVGLELTVSSMVGKWKVSQNQPIENKLSVVEHLQKQDQDNSAAMADRVRQYLPAEKN
jgi:transcriptional regulator